MLYLIFFTFLLYLHVDAVSRHLIFVDEHSFAFFSYHIFNRFLYVRFLNVNFLKGS